RVRAVGRAPAGGGRAQGPLLRQLRPHRRAGPGPGRQGAVRRQGIRRGEEVPGILVRPDEARRRAPVGDGMSVTLEVLDPRHDPEPDGWERLRTSAGQYVTWRYDLLRAYAWGAQAPVLLTVLREEGVPVGAVSASLRGVRPRRGSYAAGRDVAGVVDVHAPGNRSQKGWWFTGDPDPARRRELLRAWARGIRRELGPGWRGVVWREVSPGEPAQLPGAVKVPLPTAPLAKLATPWHDLDAWYATLDRARRDSLRRRARGFSADPGLSVAVGPARELVTGAEAGALRAENDLKHRARLFPLAPLPQPYLDALVG